MKQIGEILIEQGAINQEQLVKALELQKKEHRGKRLGEVLIALGIIIEDDIVVALSVRFNFPYLPLKNFNINHDALPFVPIETARENVLIPIDVGHGVLTLVMADPSEQKVKFEIEKNSKMRVQTFIATRTEVLEAIDKTYKVAKPHTSA